MRAYWDTSALAALYLPEVHSAAAAASLRVHKANILLTELHEMELGTAIQLRVFWRQLDAADAAATQAAFRQDCRGGLFLLTPLPPTIFVSAARIAHEQTARIGARALDLLHVAAALDLGAEVFFSFDRRQRALAKAVNLSLAPI